MIRGQPQRGLGAAAAALAVEAQAVHLVEESMEPPRVPKLWSMWALAERWHAHRVTIYRLHHSGCLSGFRVLGCLRSREEGVEIEEGEQ